MTTSTPSGPAAHPKPRHHPVLIAPETWVIQDTLGEGTAPMTVHLNSMVIRSEEPIVVDTGVPDNRERYLEDLFALVEPDDVRWVFVSHDDIDHYGNAVAVMQACPDATLVASWFMCERMGGELSGVPPHRWRWLGDGDTLDVGDRVLSLVRPPSYDSPTTRGLYDPTTGVYWASDAYATPVEAGTEFVDQLDPSAWADGFSTFQTWNSPWLSMVDPTHFDAACRRVEDLAPTTIATTHGPTVPPGRVEQAFTMMRSLAGTVAPPQPDQVVLDQIVAEMSRTTPD
ncbi:MBL fold metallo-hydrolase [Rhabdothermincola salaria]|uniref:MBL fold metallo-hydrolase n=1 Tax=Rhabdothermincola salaria TaxID=2903142 RepID=UPI001E403534|nr:MBL fold metallo-hydrolase [Rhabdothermincola salaria]MCD9622387.1 MBL fold metallo-hydrolase [Rhabdothermincola salaria]